MLKHPSEYAGLSKFLWFFGVVEDRHDPLYLGRVRVRCFGWHTDNKSAIPTASLPWAQVMLPITSAGISGIGQTPLGLVEGSWVVGFFLDGERAQQPFIMGAVPGIPQNTAVSSKGFNDPNGMYPITADEVDTNILARTAFEAKTHKMMAYKLAGQTKNVPTAKRYKTTSVAADGASSLYDENTWSEPAPRDAIARSLYPLNHVFESEAGHVQECDTTPGARRWHQYHPAGTYQEIQDDGSRITKVVGSDYEITINDKHVLIKGACNITVAGNARVRVDGDFIQEVLGNYYLMVHGSRYTKVMGNDTKEVISSQSTQTNGDVQHRISGDMGITIGKNLDLQINKNLSQVVGVNITSFNQGNTIWNTALSTMFVSMQNMNIGAGRACAISAGTTLKLRNLTHIETNGNGGDVNFTTTAGNFNITTSAGNFNITASGEVKIVGSTVSLNP